MVKLDDEKSDFVSVRLPRELWSKVLDLAKSQSPRVTGAAMAEHLVRLGLKQLQPPDPERP